MNTKNETQPTPDRYRQATVTITFRSEGLLVPEGSDWRSYLAGALRDDLAAACDVLEEGDVEWGDWEDDPTDGEANPSMLSTHEAEQ
jgi:hypothetical protein